MHRSASDNHCCQPRRPLLLRSAAVALLVSALLLATSSGLPMAWDEGHSILRAFRVISWLEAFGGAAPWRQLLSQQSIARHWHYTTAVEGHPAFFGTVIAAGFLSSCHWLTPLDSCRFGPILLFGMAAGAMFYRMTRDYGTAAAAGAAAALLTLPRLFAHAHFAYCDGPLTACWILAWAAFAPALAHWRWSVLWGVTLGMTLSCKTTGWFAPVPFLVFAALYRDGRAVRALIIGLPTALVVFLLLNPPLWHQPIQGFATFLQLGTDWGFKIPTQFLGRLYDRNHPLPWYNTILWTAITTPGGTLVLLVIGLVGICRRWRVERAGMLLLGNWLILLVIRALPFAPPHDAVRLFLPSLAFLAAIAGVGFKWLLDAATRKVETPAWRRGLLAAAALLLYGPGLASLAWYGPQWLSYYNVLIGGVRGAAAMGMEPTYYWDSLDRSVLDWLNKHTDRGEQVCFAACPPENLSLMQTWHVLETECTIDVTDPFRWYVIQHRPSTWKAADRWLVAHETPVHRKLLRPGGWGPWRANVPLIDVYSNRQYRLAEQSVRTGRAR